MCETEIGMRRKRAAWSRFKPEQIVAALRASGGIRLVAARMLKCSPSSISNYIDRFPEINDALADICSENLDIAESILLKSMACDDKPGLQLQAAKYYLRKRGSSRGYGPASRTLVKKNSASKYDVARLSSEEQQLLNSLLSKAYVGPP